MIIINSTGGRTGNQLISIAHLYASSLQHGFSFINVGKYPAKSFHIVQDHKRMNLNSHFFTWLLNHIYCSSLTRSLLSLFGVTFIKNYNLKPNEYVELFKKNKDSLKIIVPYIWPYTDYEAIYKQVNEVRKLFTPKIEYIKRADKFLKEPKTADHTLIGVHIRRTDYKDWFNGMYYFDIDTYQNYILQIIKLSPIKTKFIICSDEEISSDSFPKVPQDYLSFSRNDFITDFIILSRCHYLIGPPSTFSSYASFYGGAKKFTLFTKDAHIESFSQFGVCMIDYDEITEFKSEDGTTHREYIRLDHGKVTHHFVPTYIQPKNNS